MSRHVVVIGNGETRRGFRLSELDNHITYGCNAIVRDYTPKHVFACDKAMVEEIVDSGSNVYTRQEWRSKFHSYPYVKYFPDLPYKGDKKEDQPMNWGSGTYALLAACGKSPSRIFIMGFDMYSPWNQHNNVYKGTDNYNERDAKAVDPKFWIYQLNKIHELFPKTEFTYVYPEGWPKPGSWVTSNVSRINYECFSKILLTI